MWGYTGEPTIVRSMRTAVLATEGKKKGWPPLDPVGRSRLEATYLLGWIKLGALDRI
jgi:hypothetical protein